MQTNEQQQAQPAAKPKAPALSLLDIMKAGEALEKQKQSVKIAGVDVRVMSSDDFDRGIEDFGGDLVAIFESASQDAQGNTSFDLSELVQIIAKLPKLMRWLVSSCTDISEADSGKLAQNRRTLLCAGALWLNFVEDEGWRCFFGAAARSGLAVKNEQQAASASASTEGTDSE